MKGWLALVIVLFSPLAVSPGAVQAQAANNHTPASIEVTAVPPILPAVATSSILGQAIGSTAFMVAAPTTTTTSIASPLTPLGTLTLYVPVILTVIVVIAIVLIVRRTLRKRRRTGDQDDIVAEAEKS